MRQDDVSGCLCVSKGRGKTNRERKAKDRHPEREKKKSIKSLIPKLALLLTCWTAFSICLTVNKLHQSAPSSLFVMDVRLTLSH